VKSTGRQHINYELRAIIRYTLASKPQKDGRYTSWVHNFRETISPATYLNKNFVATGDSRARFPISSNEVIIGVRVRVIDMVSVAVNATPWKHPRLDVGNEDEAFLDLKEGFRETVMGLRLWLYFCYSDSQSRYASNDDKDEACRNVLSRGILALSADNSALNF
jgi:hypothetical protein